MEWKKIKNKLPPMGIEVLIAIGYKSEFVTIGYRLNDEWRYLNGNIISSTVTHWQPLPEPPKE